MTPPAHVEVAPPGSLPYRITIGAGLAARIEAPLAEAGTGRHLAIVSSPRVWQAVRERLSGTLTSGEPILMPDGERHKHLTAVSRIYDGLLQARVDRATTVVAVGGGVVGDTAGFAAATFLRGLALVHVPTTLLAQVDSAIGGKVGVNHAKGKNLIGAFHQPSLVLIDPQLLRTLPAVHLRQGLAEAIKHGVIADAAYFAWIAASLREILDTGSTDDATAMRLVQRSVEIKVGVVAQDEREGGVRKILNFGHTIAHAIEHVTGYGVPHGDAVAIGMVVEATLAERIGLAAPGLADTIATVCDAAGLPVRLPAGLDPAEIVVGTRSDKKTRGGVVEYALPTRLGAMAGESSDFGIAVPEAEVLQTLQHL